MKKVVLLSLIAILVLSAFFIFRIKVHTPPSGYNYELVYVNQKYPISSQDVEAIVAIISNQYYTRTLSRPRLITDQYMRLSLTPSNEATFTPIDVYINTWGDSFIAYGSKDLMLDKKSRDAIVNIVKELVPDAFD